METCGLETNEADLPSSYSEFSDVHTFLQRFRTQLALPEVTLSALEGYFVRGECENENNVVVIVHRKLLNLVIRRYVDKNNWMAFAGRFAYANSVAGTRDYDELTAYERLKLLKCLCEAQFDRNLDFKACLAKIPEAELRDRPLGMDYEGQRYWLLQDSNFDVRLYAEFKYMEYPFDLPRWKLVSRNLEQLEAFIESLRKKQQGSGDEQENENASTSQEDERGEDQRSSRKRSRRSSKGRKGKVSKPKFKGGCLRCHKDNDYGRMLLCDGCDLECHAYCQYPILWVVPEGEWFCPRCRQEKLISSLWAQCDMLQRAKQKQQQALEEQHKKMLRLARGGLSMQNIIEEKLHLDEAGSARRSSRARKEVNYAELNEIHLPHWNRRELFYTPKENASPRRTRNTAPLRSSRRGVEEAPPTVKEADLCTVTVHSEPLDRLELTAGAAVFPALGRLSGSSEESFEELRCSVSLNVISQRRTSCPEPAVVGPNSATEKEDEGTRRVKPVHLFDLESAFTGENFDSPSLALGQTKISDSLSAVLTCARVEGRPQNSPLSLDPVLPALDHVGAPCASRACDPESGSPSLEPISPSPVPEAFIDGRGSDVEDMDTTSPISASSCSELRHEKAAEVELTKSNLIEQSLLPPSSLVQKYGLSGHHVPLAVDEL